MPVRLIILSNAIMLREFETRFYNAEQMPSKCRANAMQFYYGAIYPIGVNDGKKGEQWIQTNKRRLLEMPLA